MDSGERRHGTALPFTPFDRFAQFEASQGHSLEQLLDEFEELRQGRLEELRALELTPESLQLVGAHPELGRVTLGQLLAVWVVHDLGHIAQITRVMAKQYGGEIGPWKTYLPIVQGRSG